MKNYGKELILDIHECGAGYRFNRKDLKIFLKNLVKLLDMKAEKLIWWDYKGMPEEYAKAPPHLKGISAIQFIRTSNIVIHTLDSREIIYLNIFSCKDFDADKAAKFCEKYFEGRIVNQQVIDRI